MKSDVQFYRPESHHRENASQGFPSRSKTWQNAVLEAAGIAVLYVLPIANAFFKPWHVDSFHHAHPAGSIPRAIFFLTLLIWTLASLVIAFSDLLRPHKRNVVWIALTTLLIWLLGRIAAGILDAHPTVVVHVMLATHISMAGVAIGLLAAWRMRTTIFQRALNAGRAIFAIAAFGMLILLPKLAWQGFRFEAPDKTAFANRFIPASVPGQPRIVWILMDELSDNEVFEHRPAGLRLPNLERFAERSVRFSNLQPTGYYTELVIPSLFLGQPIADIEHVYGRPFRYRSEYRGPWHSYDPARTTFGEAKRLGWTTGLVGWFNPYCRYLTGVLDRCFWQHSDVYPGFPVHVYYDRSTLANLLALLPPHERMDPFAVPPINRETRIQDYRDVMTQSENLLRDTRIRFVMLHLPVPHPPGFYDRKRHILVPAGNYIDNLALADDTLGQLLRIIRSTPEAPKTSVILCSDHSWRVDHWKDLSDWTPEEQRISGARFDPRPVLMVHLPESEEGKIISAPVSLMFVHTLLDAMLRGQIHSESDIESLGAKAVLVTAKAREP